MFQTVLHNYQIIVSLDMTGGILSESKGTIGPDNVTVPSRFYKVIYDLTGEKKMIAFILPNEKGTEPIQDYVVTVDSVQKVSGIDFFHCLPDSIQNRLENTSDISKWDFNIASTSSTRKSVQFIGTTDTLKTVSGQKQCAAFKKVWEKVQKISNARV
jgi:endonuclease G, mitochondrial